MNQPIIRLVLAVATLLCLSTTTVAQPMPPFVPFSGQFTDAAGVPLEGEHWFGFAFFAGSGRRAPLLFDEVLLIDVVNGHVEHNIGSVSELDTGIFAQGDVFLQIGVDGVALRPRRQVMAVPYALYASNVMTEDKVLEIVGQELAELELGAGASGPSGRPAPRVQRAPPVNPVRAVHKGQPALTGRRECRA